MDGQGTQALHAADIVLDVRVIGVVDQRAVVDRVAGEQNSGDGLPQGNAAWGVAGQVKHLEVPVAEIKDVAVREEARRWCARDQIAV